MSDRRPEALTVEELRRLLVERRGRARKARLRRFCSTGHLVERPEEGTALVPSRDTADGIPRLAPNASPNGMDRLLLGMEILAILGLLGVVLSNASLLRRLNQEVSIALQQPALTPTPLIMAVVLPDGHTPPNAPGGAQPNEAEIPEHLRPLVQSIPNLPIPTPGSEQALRIQIPAIGVDAPVVQGDGWEQLKRGVAQHPGTADPGENGNVVLSGHNDVFGEVFRDLDRLKPGDTIILFTSQRQYVYIVTGTQMVRPTQVEVMEPTPNATATLISCHPYLVDDHRIVVTAALRDL